MDHLTKETSFKKNASFNIKETKLDIDDEVTPSNNHESINKTNLQDSQDSLKEILRNHKHQQMQSPAPTSFARVSILAPLPKSLQFKEVDGKKIENTSTGNGGEGGQTSFESVDIERRKVNSIATRSMSIMRKNFTSKLMYNKTLGYISMTHIIVSFLTLVISSCFNIASMIVFSSFQLASAAWLHYGIMSKISIRANMRINFYQVLVSLVTNFVLCIIFLADFTNSYTTDEYNLMVGFNSSIASSHQAYKTSFTHFDSNFCAMILLLCLLTIQAFFISLIIHFIMEIEESIQRVLALNPN